MDIILLVSKAPPDSDFLPEHLQASEIAKLTWICLKFTPYNLLMSTNECTKNYGIWWKISEKTLRGDNWSAAIIGRLPVHETKCDKSVSYHNKDFEHLKKKQYLASCNMKYSGDVENYKIQKIGNKRVYCMYGMHIPCDLTTISCSLV